jgi:hypothetical protein
MNAFHFYLWALRLIPVLAATGLLSWVLHIDRTKPGSPIAAFVRHRDRVWFALLLLLVPFIVSRFVFSLFWPPPRQGIMMIGIISSLFSGAIFGTAACLFASPGKRQEPFNFWMTFVLAVVLILFSFAFSTVVIPFRNPRGNLMPFIFVEIVLIVCYFIWRMVRGNKSDSLPDADVQGDEKRKNKPAHAFLWLLVALAPIPLLLIMASAAANGPVPALGPILILSLICCLVGGIGCLRGIRNIAVRVILGIFLACFFFGLSVIVALFEACSHSGGI